MATITKTYPTDQNNYWSTGISIPAGQYISSISISCASGYNQASQYVALYIDGKQLATIAPNLVGPVSGSVSGTITGTTISASQNTFSFRAEVTITYTLASYATARSISKTVSPSGAGSFTVKKNGSEVSSAYKNDTIAVAASANSGYVFKNWTTSPANLPSSSTSSSTSFTMPDSNVSITANFYKLSTGSLNKSSMEGGSTVTLTITTQSTGYKHYYNLSFGSGMATGDVLVNAGTTSVTFTVPLNWSAQIPNATSKGSGTLTLKTYDGNTYIGSTTISNLTYTVPASVKPSMGTITTSIARTIDGVTYANIGEVYVQNHCGVRVQASASGQQSATITSLALKIGSFSGNKYNKTVNSGSIDFTSGLLGTAGTITITVTATDSRARTNSESVTITVTAYSRPSGSLNVWRVNSNGTADDMGVYGKYQISSTYSQIGNNTLEVRLYARGDSVTNPNSTGDILPGNRKEFNITEEYTITLMLEDGLHTTVITTKLPSARFVMAFDSTGNKIGIMKFPNKTIPSGKNRTFEISEDTQVYIGNDKLVDCTIFDAELTLASGFTASAKYVYKCSHIASVRFADLMASTTDNSGWVTVLTLPNNVIPKWEQNGYLSNDTDYSTTEGGQVFQVKVKTNGDIQVYKPQASKKMWGGMTFICE